MALDPDTHRNGETAGISARLAPLVTALVSALTPADVAEAAVGPGADALGAVAAALVMLDEHGAGMTLLGAAGYPPEALQGLQRFPVTAGNPLAEAVRTGEPVFLPLRDACASRLGLMNLPAGYGGCASVPLPADGRFLGALGFVFAEAHAPGPEESALLKTVAALTAAALARAQRYEAECAGRTEAQVAVVHLQAAERITDPALTGLPLEPLLNELLRRIREALGGDTARLLLLTEDGRHLVLHASQGLKPETIEPPIPIGQGIAGRVAETRRPMIVEDVAAAEPFSLLLRARIRSLLLAPLIIEDRVIGVVDVGTVRPRRFTVNDLRLLEVVADRTALVIERANLQEAERRAREQAEDAQARLEAILCQMPLGILIVEVPSGRLTLTNQQAGRILGRPYPSESLVDFTRAHGLHDDGRPFGPEEWPIARALRGEVVEDEKVTVMRSDGSCIETSQSAAPVHDRSGRTVAVVLSLADISERRRAERALERYRLLSEHTLDIILFVRPDGRIVDANEAALRAYGYSREELLAKTVYDLRTSHGLLVAAQMEEAESGGVVFETVHRRRDGSTFPVEVSSRGATIGGQPLLLSIVRDISERKAAEEERERLLREIQRRAAELDAALGSISNGLLIYGVQSEVLRMNPPAEQILGFSLEQWRALSPEERAAVLQAEEPDGRPINAADLPSARALRGEVVMGYRLSVRRSDGTRRDLLTSAAPIRDPNGHIAGSVINFTDITPVVDLQRLRDDILRAVSHDLRNPLAAVLGQAQLLSRRLQKAGLDREQASAEAIVTSAQRMNTMIQDLVDAARSEFGQLQLNRLTVDMPSFVLGLKERLAAMMETERIRVDAPPDLPPVWADPDRLERIFTNLLSNALKYSQPGTEITVSIKAQDRNIITAIRDRGPGIPAEDLPHIFERYYRMRGARERRQEGLGLGLYITRELVEAHGGRVWAESTEGVGSTFYVSLPAAAATGGNREGEEAGH